MTTRASTSIAVFGGPSQDLSINVVGADVVNFRSNRPSDDRAPQDAIPDPVELFVAAVNQQMFARFDDSRGMSSARILNRAADVDRRSQSWRVTIEESHPSCLRVLVNLLAARELDSIAINGSALFHDVRPLEPMRQPYPSAPGRLPFVVEREVLIRSNRDRFIQIEFVDPPTDEIVDSLSVTLELWCDLLMLGGYPTDDIDARSSGVIPDGPILLDNVTLELAFPEAFLADDAAFNCILNHLYYGERDIRIAKVRIR